MSQFLKRINKYETVEEIGRWGW